MNFSLLGKRYPVKDTTNGDIVAYRTVKHEFHIQNHTCAAIALFNDLNDKERGLILVDYSSIPSILNMQELLSTLPELS